CQVRWVRCDANARLRVDDAQTDANDPLASLPVAHGASRHFSQPSGGPGTRFLQGHNAGTNISQRPTLNMAPRLGSATKSRRKFTLPPKHTKKKKTHRSHKSKKRGKKKHGKR